MPFVPSSVLVPSSDALCCCPPALPKYSWVRTSFLVLTWQLGSEPRGCKQKHDFFSATQVMSFLFYFDQMISEMVSCYVKSTYDW